MSLLRRIRKDGDDHNRGGEPEQPKQDQGALTVEQLIRFGTLSIEAAEFLRACVIARLNIAVSGATGAGKTTLLDALASFIPSGEQRVILQGSPTALEQILGGASEGVLFVIEADSPRSAIQRLQSLASPDHAGSNEQIVSSLNLIVQIDKLSDGSRKITRITEVQGVEGESIMLSDIYEFEQSGSEAGKVVGRLRPTGLRPQVMQRLSEYRINLAPAIFGVARPNTSSTEEVKKHLYKCSNSNCPGHLSFSESCDDVKSDKSEFLKFFLTNPFIESKTVQFTAFHPKDAGPDQWYTLLVYAHIEAALSQVQGDAAKFAQEMGGDARKVTGRQNVQLARGTELRFVPEGEGLEFKPAFTVIKWDEDFERAAFRFRANADLLDQPANGEILIYTGPVEIARIRFSTFVTAAESAIKSAEPRPLDTVTPDNPLARAKFTHSTAQMYSKIFISYSRADADFAKAYRLAQVAAGHDVFLDTESIRTGENWQAALAKAIDNADIFQLFWSESSAASPNVRDEWDYALKHKCSDDQCVGFIRPVFWNKPMPKPPSELEHLNFRYVPFTGSPDEG